MREQAMQRLLVKWSERIAKWRSYDSDSPSYSSMAYALENGKKELEEAVSIEINATERWYRTECQPPTEGLIVDAMMSDGNVVQLVRLGRLWFIPDFSSYVYFTPIFWKPRTEN